MKSHPNPLLTAKVAPPINPALLKAQPVKPVVDNAQPPKPAETKATDAVVSSSQESSPAAPASVQAAVGGAQQPVKNFPNIKIDVTLTAEEIEAEMEKARVSFISVEKSLRINLFLSAGKKKIKIRFLD